MENWSNFCSQSLIDKIVFYLTGVMDKSSLFIKVNSENLSVNGELYFHNSLYAWKKHMICNKGCVNILQHFLHKNNMESDNLDKDLMEKVNICDKNL